MFNQNIQLLRGITAALVLAGSAGALGAMPDLVPMPKSYTPAGGEFTVSGAPLRIAADVRQCAIGAEDVAARIMELGGPPGPVAPAADVKEPGIYIVTAASPAGAALIGELGLTVTADDPGPQGYVIQPAGARLAIIGGDQIGALYGAMTLRQMLQAGGGGRVVIAAARVYDRPDYRYRSSMSVGRGLRNWTFGETNVLAAYQAGLDWMMRFKVNLLTDYESFISSRADPRAVGEDVREFVKKVNVYAAERGIYPVLWRTTSIGAGEFDAQRPEFQNWDCLAQNTAKGDMYFCWSRDELARENIARVMDLFNACGFKILALHPVDGGGISDPETWSRRCRQCRRRFANERWQASVNQYGLWTAAFKKLAPADALFTSCIYPYNAGYADFGSFKVPEDLWRKNSLDYWRQVHAGIDPAVIPMSWMARPEHMQVYREHFPGRPLFIYAHSFVPAGYFGSWHRLNRTNYAGDARDLFYLAAGFYQYDRWLNMFCSGEYAWNTAAPGNDEFRGWYYDIERDHREPREIFEEWVPRACRAFFGPELGELLAPVYQAGVLHAYIMDPGAALAQANKQRRRPMADVDPEDREGQTAAAAAVPDLRDSADRMAVQVAATTRAWEALQAAYPQRARVDPYRQRILVHYYRRMPLWRLTARARHAIYTANDCEAAGDRAGARRALAEGLRNFEADWLIAAQALELTRAQKDMTAVAPLDKRGDVRPVPAELKRELETRLAGLDTVLGPRGPRPAGAKVKVAIYQGVGAELTKKYFDQFANVQAGILDTLALAALAEYDCLLVMQSSSLDRHDYFHGLNRYVREGGRGVLFQHDLCGFARSPFGETTPFPEIVVKAPHRVDALQVQVAREHPALPGLKAGQTMEHMYYDHVAPEPGPAGVVLLKDAAGRPVTVAGQVGAGKVIFDGNVNLADTLNVARHAVNLDGFINAALMRGAVEWFTGVQLH